jgi:hypothetical protein
MALPVRALGLPGRYRLIADVFNTLWALLTQEDQVRCVRLGVRAGARLREGLIRDPC